MKNERSGCLIDQPFLPPARQTLAPECALGLRAGQALVPKVELRVHRIVQRPIPALGSSRRCPRSPIQLERFPQHHVSHLVLLYKRDQPLDRAHKGAGFYDFAWERDAARIVADGDPNPGFSDVQGHRLVGGSRQEKPRECREEGDV